MQSFDHINQDGKVKNTSLNNTILILMMIQPFLSATFFGPVQIAVEVALWSLLIYGVLKSKLNRLDIWLLVLYAVASTGSLILNDFHTFSLNLKLFGLAIFTLIYFRKVYFKPIKLLLTFLVLNVCYGIAASKFGLWLIESAWFFEKSEAYIFSRPVGFLGSPHATSTCLAIFFLYYFQKSRNYLLQLLILYSLILYSSWTVFLSTLISVVYILIQKFFRISIHPIFFLGVGLFILFFSVDLIFAFAVEIENSRYYSLEIMLPMIFDSKFYQGAFPLFPMGHDTFIAKQRALWDTVGNEMGFIKIFVEGGVLLAIVSLYAIYRRITSFSIIFLVTLFHYSYFINMPIIIYLAMTFHKDIAAAKSYSENELFESINKNMFEDKKLYT